MSEIVHLNVFGLKVSNFLIEDIFCLYDKILESNENIIVFGYSFGTLPLFKKFPSLYPKVNSFDVLVCDGVPFYWYCLFFGYKLKTSISIPEITNVTLNYANNKNLRVLLFGAKKDINLLACKKLSVKYPNIVFLEGIDGYFNDYDEEDIVNKINDYDPDILLIGISSPVKENFAFNYKSKIAASIIIPCGGMIDVYSGKTKQTPRLIKKLGFATIYRLVQEPKRLFFIEVTAYYEFFLRILPITIYNKFILRKKFNLVERYLKKET